MYRFFSRISNSHLILVRKKVTDGSCSALIVMQAPRRHYGKKYFDVECQQPKAKPKSHKFLFGMAGLSVLTGAFIVYAKNTDEVRKFLEDYVPPLDRLVALAYQENTTYYQFASDTLEAATKRVRDFVFGKEGRTPMQFPNRPDVDLEIEAEKGFAPKLYKLPPPFLEPLYVEEIVQETPEVEMPATLVQTEKCTPAEPLVVAVSKEVVEWEKEMFDNTKKAIDSFKAATASSDEYILALTYVIETPPDEADALVFGKLKAKRMDQLKAYETATESSAKARELYATLSKMIENDEIKAPPESLTQVKRFIQTFSEDLDKAENDFKESTKRAIIYDAFREQAQAARQRYKAELQMLFPGIDLNKSLLDAKGDVDLLLIYTMRQIVALENELAQLQTVRDKKLRDAIACKDQEILAEVRAEELINRERLQKELDVQKAVFKMSAEYRKKMNEELTKQGQILTKVHNDTVKKKEMEIQARMKRAISEANEKENVEYKKQLAAMAGKLKALETALVQQQKAEAQSQKAKSIWAAAESLLAATRRPVAQTPIVNEVKALEKAGTGDQLVTTVVKGIRPDVREKGILTEKALHDMFDNLEKTANSLALIGREGASLPMYMLSWLQSKLIFPQLAEIPKDELENRPTDFSKLDNFDIMHRARYYMDRNELPRALRYVNLLQGAPRVAARCWADAAIRHLEVRQAAETVMAHAALSGMP